MNFHKQNYFLLKILLSFLLIFSFSCVHNNDEKLNKFQKEIIQKVKSSKTTKDFFEPFDTIFIKVSKDLIFDSNPIICTIQSGYVIANPFMKNIIIINNKGDIVSIFGRDGEGPGEFRNIQSICADEKNNIFLFDNFLGRITKYDNKGNFKSFFKIKILNELIRQITAYKNYVFFHHAPLSEFEGFITKYDSLGNSKTFLPKLNGYEPYYERGFLDGAIIRDNSGNIYETNVYDLLVKKISKSSNIKIFNYDELNYKILSPTANKDYRSLIENYRNATIPIGLYLVNENKIVVQELLFFSSNHKKINRQMIFYDVEGGIFLGQLNIDKEHSFDASDGKYLLKFIDPSLYPIKLLGFNK